MKKLIVALIALVVTACGGAGNQVAATVNGTDITVGEVEANVDSQEGTISKETFAQFLGIEIQWAILVEAFDQRFDLEFTDSEIRSEADAIFDELKRDDETREQFLAQRGITEEFLLTIGHQRLYDQAIREELSAELPAPTEDEIQAALDSAEVTVVCVSHILVETLPEAEEVMGRLDAGEGFAELATELSLDQGSASNGGVLPCGSPNDYVEQFRAATLVGSVGEVHPEVVETEFGFHVIQVTDRSSEEEIADSLTARAVRTELETWLLDAIREAEVTVTERFGTWETEPQPRVVAPSE